MSTFETDEDLRRWVRRRVRAAHAELDEALSKLEDGDLVEAESGFDCVADSMGDLGNACHLHRQQEGEQDG